LTYKQKQFKKGKNKMLKSISKIILIASIALTIGGCLQQNPISSIETITKKESPIAATTPQGEIAVASTYDQNITLQRRHIFCKGVNNKLYERTKDNGGSWSLYWTQIGGSSSITGNIASLSEGGWMGQYQYIFSKNTNNNLVWISKASLNDPWSTWQTVGPTSFKINSDIAVSWNSYDLTLCVFARSSTDNNLYVLKQNANETWPTQWVKMASGTIGTRIAVAACQFQNGDYNIYLQLFVKNSSNQILTLWQQAQPWSWTPVYINLGGKVDGNIASGKNLNGRCEIFGINNSTQTLSHKYQLVPGVGNNWSAWEVLGGSCQGSVATGSNSDGRLEVFTYGINNYMQHIYQMAPNSGWSTLMTLPCYFSMLPDKKIAVLSNYDPILTVFAQNYSSPYPISYSYQDCSYPGCWTPVQSFTNP
jgi:hypothetical protein